MTTSSLLLWWVVNTCCEEYDETDRPQTLTLGYLINLIILTHNGIGMPMSTLTLDNMVNFLKITLAIQAMYYANIFCIKVSILFTYIRFGKSAW